MALVEATGLGLLANLPVPGKEYSVWTDEDKRQKGRDAVAKATSSVPAYRQRKGFVSPAQNPPE